jgi:predicted nucleic acid-binding protein
LYLHVAGAELQHASALAARHGSPGGLPGLRRFAELGRLEWEGSDAVPRLRWEAQVEMKPRVYLDSSVLGGAFDSEFQEETEALLELIRAGEMIPVISEVTEAEMRRAPEQIRELLDELFDLDAEYVQLSAEAEALAAAYIAAGVVVQRYEADALHIALATIAKVDVLLSWNFKHIVNLRRIRGFNGVNLIRGYSTLEIRSPKEVIGSGNKSDENL